MSIFHTASKIACFSLSFLVTSAYGAEGQVTLGTDGGATWQAGVDGPKIEWNSDGSFKRVSSTYHQTVNFPDRRGINTAYTIAEEKGKAEIIRFIQQDLSSQRTVTEINDELETASGTKSNGKEVITKESARKMGQSLKEVTQSYASGTIRGVVKLEQGYDEKREEAWVTVGVSQKTMNAASALQAGIDGKGTASDAQNGVPNSSSTGKDVNHQPSEVRKADKDSW